MVGPWMTFHSGTDRVVGGIAQEIVERLMRMGASPGHIHDSSDYVPTITPFDPELHKWSLMAMCEEAGVRLVVVGEGPRGGEKKERLQVGVTTKVKLGSKVEAIALALKRRGALTERHELVGPANVSISIGLRPRKPAKAAGAAAAQGSP